MSEIIVVGNIYPNTNNPQAGRIYDPRGLSPCLDNMSSGGNKMPKIICELRCDEGIRFFENDICGTLRTVGACGDKHVMEADEIVNKGGRKRVINGNVRIRKLTPVECYKLQGFTAEDCKKASEVVSNSQLYKQAGNSICVAVMEAIYKKLGERYEEFRAVS